MGGLRLGGMVPVTDKNGQKVPLPSCFNIYQLQPGWTQKEKAGRTYYYNAETKESTSEKPMRTMTDKDMWDFQCLGRGAKIWGTLTPLKPRKRTPPKEREWVPAPQLRKSAQVEEKKTYASKPRKPAQEGGAKKRPAPQREEAKTQEVDEQLASKPMSP